jgi:predicted nucleic acid-binding protein
MIYRIEGKFNSKKREFVYTLTESKKHSRIFRSKIVTMIIYVVKKIYFINIFLTKKN